MEDLQKQSRRIEKKLRQIAKLNEMKAQGTVLDKYEVLLTAWSIINIFTNLNFVFNILLFSFFFSFIAWLNFFKTGSNKKKIGVFEFF